MRKRIPTSSCTFFWSGFSQLDIDDDTSAYTNKIEIQAYFDGQDLKIMEESTDKESDLQLTWNVQLF